MQLKRTTSMGHFLLQTKINTKTQVHIVDEWNHMILRVIWWWWWSEASGAMIDSIPLLSRQSTRRMLPKMGSYLVVLFSTTELVYLCGCTNILMVRTRAYVPSHRNEMIQHWMLCHEVSLMLWGHVSRHSLCEPPNPLSWLHIHYSKSKPLFLQ